MTVLGSFVRAVLLAGAGVLGASCLSPTLPLPPPSIDGAAVSAAGLWELTGTCVSGDWVYAWNETHAEDQGSFVTCGEAGEYAVSLEGKECDAVRVWQSTMDELNASTPVTFLLQATIDDTPENPNACPGE